MAKIDLDGKNVGTKKFCIKLLLFTSPFTFLLLVYLIVDPFKVVQHYNSYYVEKGLWVYGLDRDYVSTQTFLNHYKEHNYNAFVFGNSRTIAFKAAYWQKYIGPQECFYFDANSEGIYGIEKKMQLMDKLGVKMDYALIPLDHATLFTVYNPASEHLGIKHPALTGQGWFSFETLFLKAFFDIDYLPAFFDYLVTGKFKDYMKKVLYHDPISYSLKENQISFYYYDSLVENNPNAYYASRMKIFYQRPAEVQYQPPIIADTQKTLLKNIKVQFDKNHTQYRIMLSPGYDQKKLSPVDLDYLKELFGAENVYDFTGINPITQDYRHYYETSHYLPVVAREMMDSVYAKKPLSD